MTCRAYIIKLRLIPKNVISTDVISFLVINVKLKKMYI